MFSKGFFGLLALLSGASAWAGVGAQTIYIDNHSSVDIAVKKSELSFGLPYPGPAISGNCGVELRTGQHDGLKLQAFLNEIEIVKDLGIDPVVKVYTSSTILIDLRSAVDSYGTWFSVKSRSGKSLKSVIASTLGKGVVVKAVAQSCSP